MRSRSFAASSVQRSCISGGGPVACEVLVQTGAHFFVRKRLTAVDLRQTLLDFEHEPFVVGDQARDRLTNQVLKVVPALLSNPRVWPAIQRKA